MSNSDQEQLIQITFAMKSKLGEPIETFDHETKVHVFVGTFLEQTI